MCNVKAPKIENKDPAPAPPAPEESAANAQGAPELVNKNRTKNTLRNKLRIDRNKVVF